MTESGIPMDLSLWWGVMVPVATPKPIVDKINAWFAQIVGSEETKKFLADAGADPMINTPERATEMFQTAIKEWGEYVRMAKIRRRCERFRARKFWQARQSAPTLHFGNVPGCRIVCYARQKEPPVKGRQDVPEGRIVTAETAALVVARAEPRRMSLGWLWSTALLVILTFLVIYPVAMLLLGALTNTNPVVDGFGVFDLSLTNFVTVLGNPNVHLALANSLIACGGGTALAVVIGLTFSWVVVRTDTPCKGFIAAVSMIPLFVPPLVAAVAWSILASPKTGLLNTMLDCVGIDWRFNVYSMRGHDRRSSASTTRPTSTCSRRRRCATWIRRSRRPPKSPAPARCASCSR